jgi:hypothetical protein
MQGGPTRFYGVINLWAKAFQKTDFLESPLEGAVTLKLLVSTRIMR